MNKGYHTIDKPKDRINKWKLIPLVVKGTLKDDCDGHAAEIAFFLFFALFPCLLSLATMLAYLPVPDLFKVLLRIMDPFLPATVHSMVEDNLRALATLQKGGLFSFSLLLSLWTASNAMVAVQKALNDAYAVEEQRPYWKVRLVSMLLVICLACFIIVSLLLLFWGPRIGSWIASLAHLGEAFTMVWNLLRWPVIFWFMMMALSALYRYAPAIRLSWRETIPGVVAATVAWIAVTQVFSFYVNNYNTYVDTYGSTGAIVALLVWMYTSALVVLIGGEINARMRELT